MIHILKHLSLHFTVSRNMTIQRVWMSHRVLPPFSELAFFPCVDSIERMMMTKRAYQIKVIDPEIKHNHLPIMPSRLKKRIPLKNPGWLTPSIK